MQKGCVSYRPARQTAGEPARVVLLSGGFSAARCHPVASAAMTTASPVEVVKIGPRNAKNVLVLDPGTSAGAAYFAPLAKRIVSSSARAGRCGRSSGARTCSRTSPCSTGPSRARPRRSSSSTTTSAGSPTRAITNALPARSRTRASAFARAVGHARRDRGPAPRRRGRGRAGGKVVLGGHSLGGSITTAYATWDFDGQRRRARPRGPRLHRRRQQPDPGHARRRRRQSLAEPRRPARRGSRSAGSPRRSPGFQRDRLDRRCSIPNAPVARPGVPAAAGQPQAARAGDEPGPVRLRARHRDLAAEPRPRRRRTSATSPRAATRAAGTAPARSPRSSASPTMFSGIGPPAASTARPGTTRSA